MTTKSSPARLGDHHLGAVSIELGPQVLMLQGHLRKEEIRYQRKSGAIEILKMRFCRFTIHISDAHESSVINSRLKDQIEYLYYCSPNIVWTEKNISEAEPSPATTLILAPSKRD